LNQYILQCIQPERRLHIKANTQEMFLVSALLYGGLSATALFALLFPVWVELNVTGIFFSAVAGIFLSLIFYRYRLVAPLWLAIIHIPIGIVLANVAVYLAGSEQAVGFGIIFVISSAYLFHYITKSIAIVVLLGAMVLFAFTLNTLNIEGWQAIVIFTAGNCFLMGLMVWLMTRRLHQLNIKDALTGLLNRQTIDAITLNLLVSNQSKIKNLIFIVIDLNKFKLINDTKGHLEGDKVLKKFSRQLELCTHKNEHVARWGGDEFVVILQTVCLKDVQQFETKLRESTKNIIGFEMGFSHFQKADTLDALMLRADQKLYANKRTRRADDSIEEKS